MSSPLDMLIGGGGNGPGNNAMWSGGISPVKPVTDQSDHVNGGMSSSAGTNAGSATTVLYTAAGIVLAALVLLWLLGGVAIKGASL